MIKIKSSSATYVHQRERCTNVSHSNEEKERLNKAVQTGKVRIKELWRINCEQLTEFDQILLTKE